jgi:hypothetical protein
MNLLALFRQAQPRLRVTVIATLLLIVPQIGQFLTMRDINSAVGHSAGLAILFDMVMVFFLPTSVILSGVILFTARKNWRAERRLVALASLNLILAASITLFFVSPCGWAHTFALTLRGCR